MRTNANANKEIMPCKLASKHMTRFEARVRKLGAGEGCTLFLALLPDVLRVEARVAADQMPVLQRCLRSRWTTQPAPPPPRSFRATLASKHMSLVEIPHARIVFANEGGAPKPPTVSSRAKLASQHLTLSFFQPCKLASKHMKLSPLSAFFSRPPALCSPFANATLAWLASKR